MMLVNVFPAVLKLDVILILENRLLLEIEQVCADRFIA